MKRIIFLTMLCMLVFAGCQQAPSSTPTPDPQNQTVEEDTEDGTEILGTWSRLGTFLNGAAIDTGPATMIINAGTYVSTTPTCTVKGRVLIEVEGHQIDFTVDSHNCPAPATGARATYSVTVSEETGEEILTTVSPSVSGPITETYKRVTD